MEFNSGFKGLRQDTPTDAASNTTGTNAEQMLAVFCTESQCSLVGTSVQTA